MDTNVGSQLTISPAYKWHKFHNRIHVPCSITFCGCLSHRQHECGMLEACGVFGKEERSMCWDPNIINKMVNKTCSLYWIWGDCLALAEMNDNEFLVLLEQCTTMLINYSNDFENTRTVHNMVHCAQRAILGEQGMAPMIWLTQESGRPGTYRRYRHTNCSPNRQNQIKRNTMDETFSIRLFVFPALNFDIGSIEFYLVSLRLYRLKRSNVSIESSFIRCAE